MGPWRVADDERQPRNDRLLSLLLVRTAAEAEVHRLQQCGDGMHRAKHCSRRDGTGSGSVNLKPGGGPGGGGGMGSLVIVFCK